MPLNNPRTIISIRYSVLLEDSSAWEIGRNSNSNDYRNILFSEERLNLHFYLFSNLTIPSLEKQCGINDGSVCVYIITSELLPENHKISLENLVKNKKWAKVVYINPDRKYVPHSKLIKDFMDESENPYGPYAHIRLDDDDALAPMFLKKIRSYTKLENVGKVISLAKGLTGFFNSDSKKFEKFHNIYYPKIAMGLTLISERRINDDVKNIFSLGNHYKIDKKAPLIIDSSIISFIRTIHHQSDTRATKTSKIGKELPMSDTVKYFPSLLGKDII